MRTRPGTLADADAIRDICLRTGEAGGDATGIHGDDALLADVYALPYLHDPHGFCLVVEEDDAVVGYVLGAANTESFQTWFSQTWWPAASAAREPANARGEELHEQAADAQRLLIPEVAEYPAHLHIDLLPEIQRRGQGRALIEAACALLADRGVRGVHLATDAANLGSLEFYPRVGFTELRRGDGFVVFGRAL